MAKTKTTQATKILNALQAGETFTAKQAAKKFKMPVENVAKRVFDLRNEGYCVYANKTAGTNAVTYRLGKPSKAIIAAGFQAMRGAA
tara:strand:- start:8 stop:268 length:261 start_codon:yes stop_codon:yes gene_type:complete